MTWPTVTLGEVALIIRNGIFARRPNDDPAGSPILRISSVRDGRVNLDDRRFVEGLDSDVIDRFRIQPGDLLMTRYNGSRSLVGISGIVPEHDGKVVHPDKLIRVALDGSRVDPRFINYQLQAPHARDHLEPRIRTTAGQSGIAGADVRSIPLVVPPLDEQRCIVDVLEDHLSRLDAADVFLASGLRRAEVWYERLLTETLWAADYPRARVEDLLRETMRNGRSDRAAASTEQGTRTLTLTAVTKNAFTGENTKMTVTPPERARGLWLEPGDVFVQRSNTPELVGTTAQYDGPREWAIFPDLLIRLRADESKIDSRFLAAALQSKPGHDQLRRKAKGLAGSMPKIDQNAIASTTIPVPSLDDQVGLLEAIRDGAYTRNLLRTELALAQRRSLGLRRALLGAAFSGRLTGSHSELSEAEETIGV